MDSTPIDAEVIDELAIEAVGHKLQHEAAMQGKLDFKQSFEQRLALLKKFRCCCVAKNCQEAAIKRGAEHLITTLKKLGFKTAILSGGFTFW